MMKAPALMDDVNDDVLTHGHDVSEVCVVADAGAVPASPRQLQPTLRIRHPGDTTHIH